MVKQKGIRTGGLWLDGRVGSTRDSSPYLDNICPAESVWYDYFGTLELIQRLATSRGRLEQ